MTTSKPTETEDSLRGAANLEMPTQGGKPADEPRVPHAKLDDPPDPLGQLRALSKEFQDDVADFIALQVASVRIHAWAIFLNWAFACTLALAGLALVAVAAALLLQGLTSGLAILLDGNLWASQIIVGASVLVLSAVAIRVATNRLLAIHRRQTLEKLEHRRHEQDRF